MDLDKFIEIIYINSTDNNQIKFKDKELKIYSERVSYFINFQDNKIKIDFDIYKNIYEIDKLILSKYEDIFFRALVINILKKYVVMYNTEKIQLDIIIKPRKKIKQVCIKYSSKLNNYSLTFKNIDILKLFKQNYKKYYFKFYKECINITKFNFDKYFIAKCFCSIFFNRACFETGYGICNNIFETKKIDEYCKELCKPISNLGIIFQNYF